MTKLKKHIVIKIYKFVNKRVKLRTVIKYDFVNKENK